MKLAAPGSPKPASPKKLRKVRAVFCMVGEPLVPYEGDDPVKLLVRRCWPGFLPHLLAPVRRRHEWRLGNDLVGHGQGEELPDVLPRAC